MTEKEDVIHEEGPFEIPEDYKKEYIPCKPTFASKMRRVAKAIQQASDGEKGERAKELARRRARWAAYEDFEKRKKEWARREALGCSKLMIYFPYAFGIQSPDYEVKQGRELCPESPQKEGEGGQEERWHTYLKVNFPKRVKDLKVPYWKKEHEKAVKAAKAARVAMFEPMSSDED